MLTLSKHNTSLHILGISVFVIVALLEAYPAALFFSSALILVPLLLMFKEVVFPKDIHFFLLFIIFCLGSLYWSISYESAYGNAFTLVIGFCFALVSRVVIVDERTIRVLLIYLILALLFLMFTMFVELGTVFYAPNRYAPLGINPNIYAYFLLVGIIFLGYLFLLPCKAHLRIIIAFLAAVFLYQVIFISGSRKGIVLSILVLLIFFLFFSRKIRGNGKPVFWLIGFIMFLLASYFIYNTGHFDRLVQAISFLKGESVEEESVVIRSEMLGVGFTLFLEKPFLGWGLYQYRYASGMNEYSHSNYIEIAANHGLIGFFLYYFFFVLIFSFYLIRKRYLRHAERFLFLSLILFLVLWEVAAVTYVANCLHWVLIGVSAGLVANRRIRFDE